MIVNETLKIIKQRRSIRSFKDEQIKEEELQAVLEAGLYAPNAGDQAWHYSGNQQAPVPLEADCAAATQNLVLAAESIGLVPD